MMDKQRLQKLAGMLTEASHINASRDLFAVAYIWDGDITVIGPFISEKDAKQYLVIEAEELDYDSVEELQRDTAAQVVFIQQPE